MPRTALMFLLIGGLPGCFVPEYECRLLCSLEGDCPVGFECASFQNSVGDGVKLCIRPNATCKGFSEIGATPPDASIDSLPGVDVAAMDSHPTAADGPGQADAGAGEPDAPVAPPDAPSAAGVPERICYPDPSRCLELTPTMRTGLMLWLDPLGLPPQGSTVAVWSDRSGNGRHATPINPNALPVVVSDGISFVSGAAVQIANAAGLELLSDSFSVFVVARTDQYPPSCFVATSNGQEGPGLRAFLFGLLPARDTPGIWPSAFLNDVAIYADPAQGPVGDLKHHLLHTARVGNSLHLQVDSKPPATPVPLPSDLTIRTGSPLFVGQCALAFRPVPYLSAVVMIRGELDSSEQRAVADFLRGSFGIPN